SVRRNGRDAVIGGQRDEDPVEADLPVEVVEKLGQRAVRPERDVLHFLAVRAVVVPYQIIGRKTHGQQIGRVVRAELFTLDRGFSEIDQIIGGERRVLKLVVEPRPGNFFATVDQVRKFVSGGEFFVRHVIGGRA